MGEVFHIGTSCDDVIDKDICVDITLVSFSDILYC
jgi:hypothetical protein